MVLYIFSSEKNQNNNNKQKQTNKQTSGTLFICLKLELPLNFKDPLQFLR